MKRTTIACLTIAVIAVLLPDAEAARSQKGGDSDKEDSRTEYKAADMINRGLELIQQKQEERGLKLIKSVPENFPKAETRFKAYLAVGDFYVSKREYSLALKQYVLCDDAEDEDVQAEGLYRAGICHYNLNSFDQAFVLLRQVTADYPWSVYANEAYYYIGLCHFKLNRWARAVEALKMVGTSVVQNQDSEVLAEAGQRLFVKVEDEDLIILTDENQRFQVEVSAASGDKEMVEMELFGKSGIHYMGSIPSIPGNAQPGDGILQFHGGDKMEVRYIDHNTAEGQRDSLHAFSRFTDIPVVVAMFFVKIFKGTLDRSSC